MGHLLLSDGVSEDRCRRLLLSGVVSEDRWRDLPLSDKENQRTE